MIAKPDEVRVELTELAESYGVYEVIVQTIVHHRTSAVYELIAGAYGLGAV